MYHEFWTVIELIVADNLQYRLGLCSVTLDMKWEMIWKNFTIYSNANIPFLQCSDQGSTDRLDILGFGPGPIGFSPWIPGSDIISGILNLYFTWSRKSSAANSTNEWLVSSMFSIVSSQFIWSRKLPIASRPRTRIWFFTWSKIVTRSLFSKWPVAIKVTN